MVSPQEKNILNPNKLIPRGIRQGVGHPRRSGLENKPEDNRTVCRKGAVESTQGSHQCLLRKQSYHKAGRLVPLCPEGMIALKSELTLRITQGLEKMETDHQFEK